MKNVVILGSTGSIGINTLKVIKSFPRRFRVVGLSSFSNTGLLKEQIRIFKPSLVTVVDSAKARELRKEINTRGIRFFSTEEGLNIMAVSRKADIVVVAISGASAVYPLLAAIKAKKHICLANKESVVMAGDILINEAKKKGVNLIPVDSEHNAIFQCINSSKQSKINRIYLTGSGGPLHKVAKYKFPGLSVRQVLKHPKWKMGKKITVDSATLMNKGLEMIEARHLFGISIDKIRLLIHPEAIIHSMVEFVDGAILAQLGITDMRLPIQYALTYPERVSTPLPAVDFSKIKTLSFYRPDLSKYPCLVLAMAAIKLGRSYPAVLNAADEEAVRAFLEGRIRLVKIPAVIEKVLLKHRPAGDTSLDEILQADRWAREEARSLIC